MAALPASLQPQAPQVASITPKRVTVYTDRSAYVGDHVEPRATDANLTRGIYNGYMSPATRRHIRRTVGTWIRSIWLYRSQLKSRWEPGKPYPIMITLTLPSPQVHDDRVINRQCLQPFILYLKRHHGVTHYFWRAEAQINGNVHYHILTDRYIDARDIQIAWNKAVNALGYEDRYYERSGKVDAPSTDVHRMTDKVKDPITGELRSVDPVEYLIDYLTDVAHVQEPTGGQTVDQGGERKLRGRYRRSDGVVITYEARPVNGRIWGMSDQVRQVREPRAECTPQVWGSLRREAKAGKLRLLAMDHATLFFGDIHAVIGKARGWLGLLINSYYLHTFDWLYPGEAPHHWRSKHKGYNAPDLWIDTRARCLSTIPPPGANDGVEYAQHDEPLLITDLRRSMSDQRIPVAKWEGLLTIAAKYWLD